MSVLSGAIICESLKPGTVLDLDGMRVTRWSRYAVDDRADYQPPVWTLIEFEAPEALSDILAEKLAAALIEPGWYANWNTATHAVVVFPHKVFQYRHGDLEVRERAQRHGRQCGVPEPQLDWAD